MFKTYEVIETQKDGWEKVLRICKSKATAERAAMLRRNVLGLKGKKTDAVQVREVTHRERAD